MRNIALLIEYDGTAYGGWQVQKNSNSVQAEIEKTLSRLLQENVKIIGAGRTDAGVHAHGQVANFHTSRDWRPEKLTFALNGTLPPDIAIRASAEVPDRFHARFDAIARKYTYRIISRKSPTCRNFTAFFPFTLSLENMNCAARFLLGEKSFKSFTKYADQQRHFICNVTKAEWGMETVDGKGGAGDGEKGRQTELLIPDVSQSHSPAVSPSQSPKVPSSPTLRFEIEANRFLHGMVRAIVGTMVDLGRGRISTDEFRAIVGSEERARASMSAPACGLSLEEVKYGFDLWGGLRNGDRNWETGDRR